MDMEKDNNGTDPFDIKALHGLIDEDLGRPANFSINGFRQHSAYLESMRIVVASNVREYANQNIAPEDREVFVQFNTLVNWKAMKFYIDDNENYR